MNILVTGGAGYIGSHTCIELMKSGYDVIIADNYSNSSKDVIPVIEELGGKAVKAYDCDLTSKEQVSNVFSENDIYAVIHFAGLKAVGESVNLPLKYYKNNITGTINLLEVMEESNVKRLVFSSSATVYGMDNPAPFVEFMPLSATNPYGQTKIIIEQMLLDVCAADNEYEVSILRYFNPIGAHKSGKLGETPNGIPNNLMPYIMDVAAGKLPYLNVYGNDYDTKDGTGVRDYIHVCDLAEGHICALNGLKKGAAIFNLGTGKGYSVLELHAAAEKAAGKAIPYKITDRRPGDIGECYADVSLAEKVIGFKAKRDIDQMCEDSWNFIANKAKA